MADSKMIKAVLTNRFFTQQTPVYGVDRVSVVRDPVTILKLTSDFLGPFQKNWLYVSATTYARMQHVQLAPVPFQVDSLTVLGMERNSNGDCVWEVAENISDYRAWAKAQTMIVAMSGAQYGGKARVLSVAGNHTIVSAYRYSDNIAVESVNLVPMVLGRVITLSMTPAGIDVEFQFNPEDLFSERGF